MPIPCKACGSLNTKTHYEHFDLTNGIVHFWDQIPSPDPNPNTGLPIPQPCPIDGCLAYQLPGVPPPTTYPAVYTDCLDCGNEEDH